MDKIDHHLHSQAARKTSKTPMDAAVPVVVSAAGIFTAVTPRRARSATIAGMSIRLNAAPAAGDVGVGVGAGAA